MIYQGIPKEILLVLVEKKNKAIKTMCQGVDRVQTTKVQTLKAKLEAQNMKDEKDMDDFFIKVNGLVKNIRALERR